MIFFLIALPPRGALAVRRRPAPDAQLLGQRGLGAGHLLPTPPRGRLPRPLVPRPPAGAPHRGRRAFRLRPACGGKAAQDRLVAVFCTVLTPPLDPVLYALRSGEARVALRRALARRSGGFK